jgi:uncharacterized protein DUF1801
VGAYDAAIDPQADDIERLHDLIRQALPELPADAGGYGPFHYRYDSGREGDAHRVAVASRRHGISLYVLALTEDGRYLAESRAAEFPKASVGKSCIRFKQLDDLDLGALRSLLEEAGRLPAPGAV